MFKPVSQIRIPTSPVDAFSVLPASYGGGYILQLTIEGRLETVVFSDHETLTQYLKIMLSGQALARGEAPAAHEAQRPAAPDPVVPKRKGGRPRLSEAEKAANRARRQALKANSQSDPSHATAEATEAVPA